jgi:hypothetical protein
MGQALGWFDAGFDFCPLSWGTEAALHVHDRVLQARSVTARESH